QTCALPIYRGSALIDGLEALLDGEVLAEDLARILDLAAAGAGEIAAEQGLQHQDKRVLLALTQALREHVARHRPHLRDRYAHGLRPPDLTRLRRRAPASDSSPVGIVESIL